MGAPLGNNNAGRGREATKALESALLRRAGETPDRETISRFSVLEQIWDKQIDKALAGDPKDVDNQSAQMIIDRLEGKPRQSMEISGDEDNPLTINEITRTIVKPSA